MKINRREEQEKMDARRKTYGGKGDLPHLGGFVANDTSGQSVPLWNWMQKVLNVRSMVLDQKAP